MKTRGKVSAILLATLLLAACGGGVTGTYVDANGNPALVLSSSTAQLEAGPVKMQLTYSVDGNQIRLHGPAGEGPDMVLTLRADGTLDTPWGVWKKQ